MERRTFLKGAIVAGATPAAAWAPPRAETLASLFSEYETATDLNDVAWAALGELEDGEAMRAQPSERVQVGRRIIGRQPDGTDAYEPVYAYSVEEIESYERVSLGTQMLFAHNAAAKARVEERFAWRVAEKVGRLNAVQKECRRIEDACGYTATVDRARVASARVCAIEQTILDFVPTTLDEAARKARWIVTELQGDRTYMHDREDIAEVALAAIGRAVG